MSSTQDTSAERMTAYLDAELAAEDAAAFEAALAEDPEALSELEQLKRVISLVSALPDVQAPSDFYEKVSKRIRKRQRFSLEGSGWSLVSLSFQVLSIIVILTVAAVYMMAELERTPTAIEREATIGTKPDGAAPNEVAPGTSAPAPVQP